jgi:recombination protein RecA
MTVDHTLLEKALAQIKKNYGDESIRYATEHPEITRIPTGIIQLDSIMGGGFPLGRWAHCYGGFASGKTLVSLHLIKNAQQMGYNCAYYDLENQFNKAWASSIGVNINDLLVLDGPIIEETATKLEGLLGAVNVHIIDSVGIGVSQDELAADADEWRPGISSRAWGKLIRRANRYFDKKENMIVLINQTREAFGKMGAENPTGGRAIEYASSMSLHFKKSSWLYRDSKGNLSTEGAKTESVYGDTKPSGIEMQIRVAKSRVGDPLDSARIRLEFGSGGQFDEVWSLVRSAIFNGLVSRNGSWYTLPDGTRVQGENGLRTAFENNLELAQASRKAMLE